MIDAYDGIVDWLLLVNFTETRTVFTKSATASI